MEITEHDIYKRYHPEPGTRLHDQLERECVIHKTIAVLEQVSAILNASVDIDQSMIAFANLEGMFKTANRKDVLQQISAELPRLHHILEIEQRVTEALAELEELK